MSFSLPVRRIRLQSDYPVKDGIVDRLTGEAIRVPIASDVRFEVGIFAGLLNGRVTAASQIAATTDWSSLTLTVQASSGKNVVSKLVSSFTTPTVATWNDDTAQHCTIDLTDSETNIRPGKYRLCLTIQATSFGPYPAGDAAIEFYDAFNLNSSDPADENPGAPISRDAADLRYEPLGGGGGSISALTITVAELTALNNPSVGTLRAVYDSTYGWGIYRFSSDGTATSAPTYYRADDDSGVWTKVN